MNLFHYYYMMEDYKKAVESLKSLEDDLETYHQGQDQIYRKFISDIATGKLTKKPEIEEIAQYLKKELVDKKIWLWYA